VAAAGFVIPAIATVPAVLIARVHPVGRVTVTTLLAVEPVAPAPQPEKPPPNVTDGDAGRPEAQPESKVTLTLSPAARAPVAVDVKPAVQVARAPAFVRLPANVIAVGGVGSAIAMFDGGLLSATSFVVCTLNREAV
jgi:hypothetical protein